MIERDWASVPVVGVTELPDVEIDEDDPFELLFTSGTTGRPKAAILSHRAVLAYIQLQSYGAARGKYLAGVKPGEQAPAHRYGSRSTPSSTSSGLSTVINGVELGCEERVDARSLRPAAVIEVTKREGINMWGGGSAHVMRLLEHPNAATVDPQQIWSVNVGGSATPPAVIDRAEELFPHLTGTTGSGYGATEAGLLTQATHWMMRAVPDCAGSLYPTVAIRITTTPVRCWPTARRACRGAQCAEHAGLLEQPGGDRGGGAARSLDPYRRLRPSRRRIACSS